MQILRASIFGKNTIYQLLTENAHNQANKNIKD